jgi:predicted AAA+ superfamily ATPase
LAYLNSGGLPSVYGDEEAHVDLRSYVDLYLREEIQAEALTRNVGGFGNLLDALALSNGQEINTQSLASDVGLQARTVSNYIEILEDTLLGFRLAAFRESKKRKPTSHSRFYLFDIGVTNSLCGRGKVTPKTENFGNCLAHFIVLECRALLSYHRKLQEMTYWRTSSGFEVDIVIGLDVAIEVKGTELVTDRHLKGLRAFKEEKLVKRFVCVSLDLNKRMTSDGIEIIPVLEFLDLLWKGEFF